jgi:hypothetical protein
MYWYRLQIERHYKKLIKQKHVTRSCNVNMFRCYGYYKADVQRCAQSSALPVSGAHSFWQQLLYSNQVVCTRHVDPVFRQVNRVRWDKFSPCSFDTRNPPHTMHVPRHSSRLAHVLGPDIPRLSRRIPEIAPRLGGITLQAER